MTSINALLQALADGAKRGRLMALFIMAWGGLAPIGALWQGAFAEAFGVRSAVVVAGMITAAYALAVFVFTGERPAPALLETAAGR